MKATLEEGDSMSIGFAVLTQKIVSELEALQNDDNDMLRAYDEYLADAVCMFLVNSEQTEKAKDLATNLAFMRDALRFLRVEKDKD